MEVVNTVHKSKKRYLLAKSGSEVDIKV